MILVVESEYINRYYSQPCCWPCALLNLNGNFNFNGNDNGNGNLNVNGNFNFNCKLKQLCTMNYIKLVNDKNKVNSLFLSAKLVKMK